MTSLQPVYDEAYYNDYNGESYERSEEWLGLFRSFASNVVTTLRPTRTLDAGCAIGLFVEALDELGVESHGFDVSEYAIGQVPDRVEARCWVQSLTDPIEGAYDLVTCVEVIEHLPASEAPAAVTNLCGATDAVLLSSTPDEHEEPTHLNVQPPEYWSALFAANGFFRDTGYDASFISPWAVLYRRRADLDEVELVRDYDRALWRQRFENGRLREQLLATTTEKGILTEVLTDEELGRVRASADPMAELRSIVDGLRAERDGDPRALVGALEHQLMVQRDEIMAAQRHAGEARGRAQELQAELYAHAPLRELYQQAIDERDEAVRRYDEIAASTSWRASQKLLAPYRRAFRRSPLQG